MEAAHAARCIRKCRVLLVTDIDGTLVAPAAAGAGERELYDLLESRSSTGLAFAVASGRRLAEIQEVLSQSGISRPDACIASVGSQLFFGTSPEPDATYKQLIAPGWQREAIASRLQRLPWLSEQPASAQNPHKLSYDLERHDTYRDADIHQALGAPLCDSVTLIWSHGRYLDVLPQRASKGHAVRHLVDRFELNRQQVVVAGDSGNDRHMLVCGCPAVVVADHDPELEDLRGHEGIYFAEAPGCAGILEGMQHHELLAGLQHIET